MINKDIHFYSTAFDYMDDYSRELIDHHLKLATDDSLPELFRELHKNIILYEMIWINEKVNNNE
jgi:hypothetical protein